MGDQTRQVGIEVDSDLLDEFREDVKTRHGSVYGHMRSELENAIREYLNASDGGDTHDRIKRLEDQMDRVVTLLENSERKKEDSDVGKRVESKLEDIIETVDREADGAPRVHEKVIEAAIEEHAGYSDPTIRQYKNLLKKRGEAFEDPRESMNYYFREAPLFCDAVNAMVRDGDIKQKEYLGIVEDEYGRDWWREQLQQFDDGSEIEERTPGFQ